MIAEETDNNLLEVARREHQLKLLIEFICTFLIGYGF